MPESDQLTRLKETHEYDRDVIHSLREDVAMLKGLFGEKDKNRSWVKGDSMRPMHWPSPPSVDGSPILVKR